MCYAVSCILTNKYEVLFAKDFRRHSHEVIIKENKLNDNYNPVLKTRPWIRIEICPNRNPPTRIKERNWGLFVASDPSTWQYDEDENHTLPDWYNKRMGKEVVVQAVRDRIKKVTPQTTASRIKEVSAKYDKLIKTLRDKRKMELLKIRKSAGSLKFNWRA